MTDVQPTPPPRRGVRARLAARRGTVAVVAAAVLVGGGAGAGIALAATSGGSSHSAPVTTAAAAPKASKHGTHKATLGTISAQSGSTWTVHTVAGQDVKVTISATTHFGTKKRPATESQFHTGSRIAVVGKEASGAITATAVFAPPAKAAASPSPSSSAAA